MAFIVANKRGSFEIRESHNTANGPRSRTLATFRDELTDEVIRKAEARAGKSLDGEQLRRAATRAGASPSRPPVEQAARRLIAELGRGERLDPPLRELLLRFLDEDGGSRPAAPRDAKESVA